MNQPQITEEQLVELLSHGPFTIFMIRDTEGILLLRSRVTYGYLGKFRDIERLNSIVPLSKGEGIYRIGRYGGYIIRKQFDKLRDSPNKEEIFEIVRANWSRRVKMTKSAAKR